MSRRGGGAPHCILLGPVNTNYTEHDSLVELTHFTCHRTALSLQEKVAFE